MDAHFLVVRWVVVNCVILLKVPLVSTSLFLVVDQRFVDVLGHVTQHERFSLRLLITVFQRLFFFHVSVFVFSSSYRRNNHVIQILQCQVLRRRLDQCLFTIHDILFQAILAEKPLSCEGGVSTKNSVDAKTASRMSKLTLPRPYLHGDSETELIRKRTMSWRKVRQRKPIFDVPLAIMHSNWKERTIWGLADFFVLQVINKLPSLSIAANG